MKNENYSSHSTLHASLKNPNKSFKSLIKNLKTQKLNYGKNRFKNT